MDDMERRAKQLMQDPKGRQLMELLGKDGGKTLSAAGDAVRRGDTAGAQQAIAPLLQDPEVRKLLEALSKSMGHG